MFTSKRKILTGVITVAAVLALPLGIEQIKAQQILDGVMGQSIEDETVYDVFEPEFDEVVAGIARSAFSIKGMAASYEDYIAEAWTTDGDYTSATYYHRSEYADRELLNGIDVSWWQAKYYKSTDPNYRKVSGIDWEKAHDDGIDFTFVRVASRDTSDGSIYTDTCADSHIQGALDNDINVGLYIFSQALTVEEAEEEAEYVLDLVDEYGWDVTLPIVMDREAGSYKRLTAGKLSKTKETNICNAFANVISEAGYRPMVYASASWILNYMNMDSLAENDCGIWQARYNNSTDKPVGNLNYERLAAINYEFWQYSSTGKVSGYSGNLDVDFWYKDTNVKTEKLRMTSNTENSVSLKWNKAGDAKNYRLYRYDKALGKYVAVKSLTKTSYTDTGLTPGETYQYRVRCYWTIGGINYYGNYSDVLEVTTLPGQVANLTAESQTANAITLGWEEVYGANGYRLYQYDTDTETYVEIADVTDGTNTTYQVTGLSGATEYQFKVKAFKTYNGITYWGAESAAYAAVTKPAKTGGFLVETGSATTMELSWNKVARASGYQIYRLNPDTEKYEKIATIKGNKTFAYTDSNLSTATEYTYKVRAYLTYNGTNYYGAYSTITSGITKPAKVKNVTLTTKSSAITLKWDKTARVTGYQIYRLNTKTGKYEKIATIKNNKTFSYKDTGLKKGTTYTYKVRAYKTYEGTNYYGSYSTVVKLKAK